MRERGEAGSIVTLLCDGGERYARTYYDRGWLADQGLDIEPDRRAITEALHSGNWSEPPSATPRTR